MRLLEKRTCFGEDTTDRGGRGKAGPKETGKGL